MHFDDRLATVLRHRAAGERAARTQFRQLLNLLGDAPAGRDESLEAAAYLRLDALEGMIPARERAQIVEHEGRRIRNPHLVARLAESDPGVAAAALAQARLAAPEWVGLIPELPIRARGFLRNRRDLPQEAETILDRLGVSDRGLPVPDRDPADDVLELSEVDSDSEYTPAPAEAADPEPETERPASGAIGELVQRIEAYTRRRENAAAFAGTEEAPRLPLEDETENAERRSIRQFLFATDPRGAIDWVDGTAAPMVVGTPLIGNPAQTDAEAARISAAFRARQPIRNAEVDLFGAPAVAGEWILDAAPRFADCGGHFAGYIGRFRRPAHIDADAAKESEADRIRQLLHELRTPVNAIQGFAEVIQQQVFGATPHEYRALAASIAGDSARMLAGFDELDRLVKLEGGNLELETGSSDFVEIATAQIAQLQTVLSSRVARLELKSASQCAPLPLERQDTEMLAWRLLATIASTTGAGETVALELSCEDDQLALRCALPTALVNCEDIFATENRPSGGALSPGIFGAGFSLRLARAEARAAGGELVREDGFLVLSLPLLTGSKGQPSPVDAPDRATG